MEEHARVVLQGPGTAVIVSRVSASSVGGLGNTVGVFGAGAGAGAAEDCAGAFGVSYVRIGVMDRRVVRA